MTSGGKFRQQFCDKIDSGSNVIWIYAAGDEGRCERMLKQICEGEYDRENTLIVPGIGLKLRTFDVVNGADWNPELKDPLAAMQAVTTDYFPGTTKESSIKEVAVLIRDLHLLLNAQANFGLRRCLAELCKQNGFCNHKFTRPLIIIADTPTPYADIKDYCDVLDFELPTFEEMRQDVVEWVQDSIRRTNKEEGVTGAKARAAECSEDLKDRLTSSLLGMGSEEAQRVLSSAATVTGGMTEDILPMIAEETAKVIRKIEGLTFIPQTTIRDETTIAGFEVLREFIHTRARSFSRHAQQEGVPRPRGIVLVGPPGTGKSMVAKTISKILGLDLIMLDIGSMYDSLVGSSEKRIRSALQMVSAKKNCVLMVDEIDKALSGAHQSAGSDSGVSSRLLSYFLNWLSERDMTAQNDNRTFVVVTMNRTTGVPPEMLRAGRFDRVFSTDLPDDDERASHINIQLERNGVDPATYGNSLKSLITPTMNFSGAELEEVIIAARHRSYAAAMQHWEEAGGSQGTEPSGKSLWPTIDDLVAAAHEIVPLAKLDSEAVDEIRKFCKERTTPVTGQHVHGGRQTRAARKIRTRADAPAAADDFAGN